MDETAEMLDEITFYSLWPFRKFVSAASIFSGSSKDCQWESWWNAVHDKYYGISMVEKKSNQQ